MPSIDVYENFLKRSHVVAGGGHPRVECSKCWDQGLQCAFCVSRRGIGVASERLVCVGVFSHLVIQF